MVQAAAIAQAPLLPRLLVHRWHSETWRSPLCDGPCANFSVRVIVVIILLFGCMCAAAIQMFAAKLVNCVSV